MANGDRLFGPVGASGSVTGTGANITVTLDFYPQWVELVNSVTGASMYWTKAMPAASGMVNIASGGGVTGNTSGGTPSATFDLLATHSHDTVQSAGEVLAVNPATGVSAAAVAIPIANVESVYVTAGGVTGPFTLVPGGVVPATGEVGYNPTTGVFQFLIADAVVSATVQYISRALTSVSGGTPSATFDPLAVHNHTVAAGGGGSFIAVGGITAGNSGFIIGNDASVNILGDNINWNAGR